MIGTLQSAQGVLSLFDKLGFENRSSPKKHMDLLSFFRTRLSTGRLKGLLITSHHCPSSSHSKFWALLSSLGAAETLSQDGQFDARSGASG